MKPIKLALIALSLGMMLQSCATKAKFPSSQYAPAAEITATVKKDKHENRTLYVQAKNLASPDRLSPPQNTYVVWVVAEDGHIRNIGQLRNNNAKKAEVSGIVPFEFTEVIITAEDNGTVAFPSGIEISRTRLRR